MKILALYNSGIQPATRRNAAVLCKTIGQSRPLCCISSLLGCRFARGTHVEKCPELAFYHLLPPLHLDVIDITLQSYLHTACIYLFTCRQSPFQTFSFIILPLAGGFRVVACTRRVPLFVHLACDNSAKSPPPDFMCWPVAQNPIRVISRQPSIASDDGCNWLSTYIIILQRLCSLRLS